MFLPKSEGGNFEMTPAGTFIGRCYRFIDLGSHEQKYQGESKGMRRLIMIGFELPTETMADDRPFTIHKRYTWSMHEKSGLRRDLEAWRGMKFTDADFGQGGFDTRNLLGKACTLAIVHSENGENTYANITSIGKAMKGVPVPEPINPPVYISLEPELFDETAFNSLSDKLKDFIKASPEYAYLVGTARKPKPQARNDFDHDPARDPRYEQDRYDERNPPPAMMDDDFPGDYPINTAGRKQHPVMAG